MKLFSLFLFLVTIPLGAKEPNNLELGLKSAIFDQKTTFHLNDSSYSTYHANLRENVETSTIQLGRFKIHSLKFRKWKTKVKNTFKKARKFKGTYPSHQKYFIYGKKILSRTDKGFDQLLKDSQRYQNKKDNQLIEGVIISKSADKFTITTISKGKEFSKTVLPKSYICRRQGPVKLSLTCRWKQYTWWTK